MGAYHRYVDQPVRYIHKQFPIVEMITRTPVYELVEGIGCTAGSTIVVTTGLKHSCVENDGNFTTSTSRGTPDLIIAPIEAQSLL
jgi:hypothetical protein